MYTLKKPNQLTWHDLANVVHPMEAISIIRKVKMVGPNRSRIWNLKLITLPTRGCKLVDPFSPIRKQLDDGRVVLTNSSPMMPALTYVPATDEQDEHWVVKEHLPLFFHSNVGHWLKHIERPKPYIFTENKSITTSANQVTKATPLCKHKINIEVKLPEQEACPTHHKVRICVVEKHKNRVLARKHADVISGTVTQAFKAKSKDDFIIYVIPEAKKDVIDEVKSKPILPTSVANGRIAASDITQSETLADGTELHTITVDINPILRMGCFFDGTGNDDNPNSAWSNIKLLSDLYSEQLLKSSKPYLHHSYIRGVGSNGDGPVEGVAGSTMGHGTIPRIAGMLYELEIGVQNYADKYNDLPLHIHLDVFGFSRGATSARHFINIIMQGFYGFKDQAKQTYIHPDLFKISFAGLFDSVGAYGNPSNEDDYGYNFNINDEWVTDSGKVIHFIALNEYRALFDLQTLFSDQSALYPHNIEKSKRIEVGFVGAHSDIGGGYEANTQGVENSHKNPTQLSVMTLQKMYNYAVEYGVPLAKFIPPQVESLLIDNYKTVDAVLTEQPDFKRAWQEWAEHFKQREVYQYLHKTYAKRAQHNEVPNQGWADMYKRRVSRLDDYISNLEVKMVEIIGSDNAFLTFMDAFNTLDKYYIHESHWPFNTIPFMGANNDINPDDIPHLKREVIFHPAADFRNRNKEADRIIYSRAGTKKIDIDEFDVIVGEKFDG